MSARVSLVVLGADTQILSDACAACPHHPAGCCHAPPDYDLADVARVLRAPDGRAWLRAALAEGLLRAEGDRLVLRRVRGRHRGARVVACAALGPAGCTLAARLRPATCNYYACAAALDDETREDATFPYLVLKAWWTRLTAAVAAAFPTVPPAAFDPAGGPEADAFLDALVAFVEGYEVDAALQKSS